jgi:hypothetical protein
MAEGRSPTFLKRSSMLVKCMMTPMLPVSVPGLATIFSAAQAT